jgi:hypothetical protein
MYQAFRDPFHLLLKGLSLQQAFFGLPYFMTNRREGSRS